MQRTNDHGTNTALPAHRMNKTGPRANPCGSVSRESARSCSPSIIRLSVSEAILRAKIRRGWMESNPLLSLRTTHIFDPALPTVPHRLAASFDRISFFARSFQLYLRPARTAFLLISGWRFATPSPDVRWRSSSLLTYAVSFRYPLA